MRKIKTGDEVIIIAGKDKGRRGTVLRFQKDNSVIVEGANMITKHVKPNPNKGENGGRVQREAAIDLSNISLYNPLTKKADRVGIKTLEDGKKVRFFKSNNEVIDA